MESHTLAPIKANLELILTKGIKPLITLNYHKWHVIIYNLTEPKSIMNTLSPIQLTKTLLLMLILPSLVRIGENICFSFHPEWDVEMALLLAVLLIAWITFIWILLLYVLWHQKPAKALSVAWVSGLLFIWPTSIFLNFVPIGDAIHLAAGYPKYKTIIDDAPNKRLSFDWGGFGFSFTVNGIRTLYYDPSDKLPEEFRIRDAKLRQKSGYLSGKHEYFRDFLRIKHLFEHFYLVEEWHQ